MLLFLSISGILLSAILLYFNARNNRSTIYLGLFFLFLSLYSLYQYILLYSKSVLLVSLFLFNIAIVSSPLYLIGPMLFWYIRSVLTDNAHLKRRDAWHLLPMIIFFIAAIPHAFIPWHEKVEAARTVVADAGFMGEYRATLLAKIFSPTLEYLTRPVLVLGYTLWSAGLLVIYLIRKKSSLVLSKQHFMKKWLFLLLCFLLILEVTQMLLIIRAFEMHFSELYFAFNMLRLFSVAGLIGLFISPFFFPVILYGLPRIPEPQIPLKPEEVKTDIPTEEERNDYSHFESDYLYSIGWKTDSYMKEFQPYLQPDFNLARLSENTQIPVHHIGYYFREVKKQHFIEYRNKWRINHAKSLIKEGKAKELTLEAIGKMSGFSSRNTFRTTFEKIEGIPPSAFASQIKE
jgi:AraC-like DNA-binding protein